MIDPRKQFRRIRDAWFCRLSNEIEVRISQISIIPRVGPVPHHLTDSLIRRVTALDDAVLRLDQVSADSPGYARKVRAIAKRVRDIDSDTLLLLNDVNSRLMCN